MAESRNVLRWKFGPELAQEKADQAAAELAQALRRERTAQDCVAGAQGEAEDLKLEVEHMKEGVARWVWTARSEDGMCVFRCSPRLVRKRRFWSALLTRFTRLLWRRLSRETALQMLLSREIDPFETVYTCCTFARRQRNVVRKNQEVIEAQEKALQDAR